MNTVTTVVLILILARWLADLILTRINLRHVRDHAGSVPEVFAGVVDEQTYAKSIRYTLAKGGLHQLEAAWSVLVLLLVILSGVLPWTYSRFTGAFGDSAWSSAAFVFCVGLALGVTGLPFDWYSQFHLEERFGFNTSTQKTWWADRLKGLLLALVLGYPLLVLVLKIVEWSGDGWWQWAWAAVLAFELIMVVLAPVVIMPWFNKFTPLSEGSLRDQLLALAERTGFRARSIQVMDGSRRSRHSNAFFTGFGRFRKIVLFDTLIAQLQESELAAVLAHEIGHYKKGHIPKMLVWSAGSMLAGFCALGWLARQDWFYRAFGFEPGNPAVVFLLFGLLAGAVTFWFTPVANLVSRRFEYQADHYAANAMGEITSLIGALRKLNEKNLSNLTPHPLYSGFFYSHPTLQDRERALGKGRVAAGA